MASSWSARSSNMLPMSSRMLPVLFSATAEGLGVCARELPQRGRPRPDTPPCLPRRFLRAHTHTHAAPHNAPTTPHNQRVLPTPDQVLRPCPLPQTPKSLWCPHLPCALSILLPDLLLHRLQRRCQACARLLQLLPRAVPGRGAVERGRNPGGGDSCSRTRWLGRHVQRRHAGGRGLGGAGAQRRRRAGWLGEGSGRLARRRRRGRRAGAT